MHIGLWFTVGEDGSGIGVSIHIQKAGLALNVYALKYESELSKVRVQTFLKERPAIDL